MPAGGLYLTSNSVAATMPKKNAAKRNHLQIYHCVVTSVVEIYRYFKTNCN
ncbi:hypothetical protein PF005_g2981 [Phytophthora fragariae]|uniref:Uncharacterized protein n=1 Tax=Phytophthora fragariae TaxID=53985 RepID=A0A6A3M814_9STRA|nr:hypothetical protein PF011_g2672 [Phytophthora fragariae]KAE9231747.1 hypothetical protein PF005_g2981 [Phytophthora fragariae]KAE9251446.1 hypothetical protein PF004_g2460 [Phytophthora fragariae]KAE9254743.1 hypothetical protein PF002_g2723 [Phytophthora fragariae]